MGYTSLYQKQLQDSGYVGRRPCEAGPILGISQPQVYRKDDKMVSGNKDYYGMKIENVEFTDFENLSDCTDAGSINYAVRDDDRVRYFQHQTQFQQVTFTNNAPINFCTVDQGDVDAVLRILDDSISSKLGITQTAGVNYYIGKHPAMTDLMDLEKDCTLLNEACAYYCSSPNLCMQSVIFGIEEHGTYDWTLQVENKADSKIATIHGKSGYPNDYSGYRDENGDIVMDDVIYSQWHYRMRMFKVNAPAGKSYTATFKDRNGNAVYPPTVERYYFMNSLCTPETLDITLSTSPSSSCTNLIKNGSPTKKNFAHIYQNYPTGVIDSVASPLVNGTFDAICTGRTSTSSGFAFYLDPGCLTKNLVYTVSGKIRLFNEMTGAGIMCGINGQTCPEVWAVMRQQIGYDFSAMNYPRIATAKNPKANGWHDLCGTMTVTAYMAKSVSVTLRIYKANENVGMQLHQLAVKQGNMAC